MFKLFDFIFRFVGHGFLSGLRASIFSIARAEFDSTLNFECVRKFGASHLLCTGVYTVRLRQLKKAARSGAAGGGNYSFRLAPRGRDSGQDVR